MSHPIYLDHNATTPLAPEVVEAMMRCLNEEYGNPSSTYELGKKAAAIKKASAEWVARLINASPQEIIFTGCATEANNLALLGVAKALDLKKVSSNKRHLVISAIEHPSVSETVKQLQREGWDLTVVPVNNYGQVGPSDIEKALRSDTALVSIMHANNEVGTIQPIKEISEIVKSKGVLMHTDAAQSIGKIPVDVNELGVDLLTIAGHKFNASKGIGALFVREGTSIEPILYGGGQERGLRSGTENIAAIAGLGVAARLAIKHLNEKSNHLKITRDLLHAKLFEGIPGIELNGHREQRLPNTLNISFPKVNGRELLDRVRKTISASVGSACHSERQANKGTLFEMGLDESRIRGAVRFSTGWSTTLEEIDSTADILITAWKNLVKKQNC